MNDPASTSERQAAAARDVWAIVPAAGNSTRMGAAKLLLPWHGKPLIEHLIDAYRSACVRSVVVVVRPDDRHLAERCRLLGACVVAADQPPPEMKDTVQLALAHLHENFHPAASAAWLLAPADLPQLSTAVVQQLIAAKQQRGDAILLPVHQGRRGHPTLFPWRLASEIQRLGAGEGVNALLLRHPVVEIECGEMCLAEDIDTLEDYGRLLDQSAM